MGWSRTDSEDEIKSEKSTGNRETSQDAKYQTNKLNSVSTITINYIKVVNYYSLIEFSNIIDDIALVIFPGSVC